MPHSRAAVSRWIDPVARVGLGARGVTYVLLGLLAAKAAAGMGGRATDLRGALTSLDDGPAGPIALGAIGAGLACYALWSLASGLLDLEREGSGVKGLGARAASVSSGIIYGGLALTALTLAIGGRHEHGDAVRTWTGRALSHPLGRWAVVAAGAAMILVAGHQLTKAWGGKLERRFRAVGMREEERRWALRIGRAGLSARAVTFAVIGWFLLRAGLEADPREARGVGGALRAIASEDYGRWLLFLVAAGLVAFGVLSVLAVRYRSLSD